MAVVPTVEIHNPKNPAEKWIINQEDYDASKHVLWETMVQGNHDEDIHPIVEPEHTPAMRPSVPDYVHDDDGNIVAVNIIDPERRTSRKEIPYGDFDPDTHQLWSEHPRFN